MQQKKIVTGVESRKINKGEDNEVRFAYLNPLSPLSMTVDKSASHSLFPPLNQLLHSYFKELIMKIYIKHLA